MGKDIINILFLFLFLCISIYISCEGYERNRFLFLLKSNEIEKTKGVIVDKRKSTDGIGIFFYYDIEYLVDDKTYYIKYWSPNSFFNYSVQEELEVNYFSNRPNVVIVNNIWEKYIKVIFYIVWVVFLLVLITRKIYLFIINYI